MDRAEVRSRVGGVGGGGGGGGDGEVAMHSLLSLSWGFFSDVDIESERLRWLGGFRFTVQAVLRILRLRRYKTTFRFRPLPPAPSAHDDDDGGGSGGIGGVVYGQTVRDKAAAAAARGASAGVAVADRPGWREISGDVTGVWALNVTWGAEDMHAAPGAEAGDGAYDVLIISGATRWSLLGLLLVFDAGGHVGHPAVTYIKAAEFELDPGPSNTGRGGYVAVDGELVALSDEEKRKKAKKEKRVSSPAAAATAGGGGAGGEGGVAGAGGGVGTGALLADVGNGDSFGSGEAAAAAGAGTGGAGDFGWSMPYGPMSLKVVRSAARVFGAADGRGLGGAGDAV